jgi:hypothetical protein
MQQKSWEANSRSPMRGTPHLRWSDGTNDKTYYEDPIISFRPFFSPEFPVLKHP